VEGYSQAAYKGFATDEEARRYMEETVSEKKEINSLEPGEALAYVDGSYNADTGFYSCGVVFFCEGEELHFCKKGQEKELASMRNVAGEIMGAQMAMEEALRRGLKQITIVHDYQGIASWCTGDWKTNKEGTKAYKAYFDSLNGRLEVSFQKVKGHPYNDLADELAKSVIFDAHRNTSES
jgi:ribonuclease HI